MSVPQIPVRMARSVLMVSMHSPVNVFRVIVANVAKKVSIFLPVDLKHGKVLALVVK